jgi:hypothetical protein
MRGLRLFDCAVQVDGRAPGSQQGDQEDRADDELILPVEKIL